MKYQKLPILLNLGNDSLTARSTPPFKLLLDAGALRKSSPHIIPPFIHLSALYYFECQLQIYFKILQ